MIRSHIITLLLIILSFPSHAQNLTGSWDGYMSGEKLKLYIRMEKKQLCGYSADYVLSDPSSYCKANFRGWFDEDEQVWVLMGTSFIENSGEHILMILRLWHQKGDPPNVMRGTEEAKYARTSIFSIGNERSPLKITKVSNALPKDMPDCFPKIKKITTKPGLGKEVTVKPRPDKQTTSPSLPSPPVRTAPVVKQTKPATQKQLPVLRKEDSLVIIKKDTTRKEITPLPVPVTISTATDLLKKMKERKKTEFSHLVVNDRNITLNVYDNGIVDNDSVSIFYNGKLLVNKKKLSEKPITIQLQLDEAADEHEIVMFAENLGTIPPNTALIVVTAGGKRYELHSSASLTENAVLTFEYKPK